MPNKKRSAGEIFFADCLTFHALFVLKIYGQSAGNDKQLSQKMLDRESNGINQFSPTKEASCSLFLNENWSPEVSNVAIWIHLHF